MEDNNKHNIFSKKEFFKMLDEKRSLPPEADDFDREAMEGLALVKDRSKLDKLDGAIDQALAREKKLAARKRNIYYFSAAASVMLIIGLFFILKESTVNQEKDLALNHVTEHKPDAPMMTLPAAEAKEPAEKEASAGELKQIAKEPAGETGVVAGLQKSAEAGPVEEKADKLTNSKAEVLASGTGEAMLDDQTVADANWKSSDRTAKEVTTESGNKTEVPGKKKDSGKPDADYKTKLSYETNTVWTTSESQATDARNKQQEQTTPQQKPQMQPERENVPAGVSATTGEAPADEEDVAANTTRDEAEKDKLEEKAKDKKSTATKLAGTTNRKRAKKHRSRNMAAAFDASQKQAAAGYYSQSDTVRDAAAAFVGGEAALNEFISKNLTVSEPGKKGVAIAEFTVKPDGAVDTSSIRVVPPAKDCEGCRKDVLRMLKKMPKWQPAVQDGKPREERRKLSVPYGPAPSKK